MINEIISCTLKVLKFMFTDHYGRFQWLGVSAFFALITWVSNNKWMQKNFKAEMRSEKRVEWIEDVRSVLADTISDVDEYVYATERSHTHLKRIQRATNEKDKLFSKDRQEYYGRQGAELFRKINQDINLLDLKIPNSESNKDVLECLDKLREELKKFRNYNQHYNRSLKQGRTLKTYTKERDENGKRKKEVNHKTKYDRQKKEIEQSVNQLIVTTKALLKAEWENAKNGK